MKAYIVHVQQHKYLYPVAVFSSEAEAKLCEAELHKNDNVVFIREAVMYDSAAEWMRANIREKALSALAHIDASQAKTIMAYIEQLHNEQLPI